MGTDHMVFMHVCKVVSCMTDSTHRSTNRSLLLCVALLCFASLCFVRVSCFALLCSALLCSALLCFAVLCFVRVSCFALLCFVWLCFALLSSRCFVVFSLFAWFAYSTIRCRTLRVPQIITYDQFGQTNILNIPCRSCKI